MSTIPQTFVRPLCDGPGQACDRFLPPEADLLLGIDDDARFHQDGGHGRVPQHRKAVVAVDAQVAVDERMIFALDRFGMVAGGPFTGGPQAFANAPGARQTASGTGVQRRNEDRIAREFGLAARCEEPCLRRIMVDRHEQVGFRRARRAPGRGDVRADALDPGGQVTQRRERAGEGGGQVPVVQVFGAAAGPRRARLFRPMARVHQDVRRARGSGAAQGQQGGEQEARKTGVRRWHGDSSGGWGSAGARPLA